MILIDSPRTATRYTVQDRYNGAASRQAAVERITDDLIALTCDDHELLTLAQELGGPVLRAEIERMLGTREAALADQRPWMNWGWPHPSVLTASQ